jgi:hypothetical protein
MAPRSDWFRRRVNSGRLAEPHSYAGATTITPGPEDGSRPLHGTVAPDARLPDGSRLREHLGRGFVLLLPRRSAETGIRAEPLVIGPDSVYGERRAWLVRPDGYITGSVLIDDAAGLR